MARKNTGTTSVDMTKTAYGFASADEYSAWLDDETNYVERTVNGNKAMVRRTPNVSANVPDEIHWALVQRAAGDKGRLDDGDMTYAVRNALWLYLGYDQGAYETWATAERGRISTERSVRMSGTASNASAKAKVLESENQDLKTQLESLKAQLEQFMASSKS